MSCCSGRPLKSFGKASLLREAVLNIQKRPFSITAAPALEVKHDHVKGYRQAHVFQVWSSFF